MTMRIWAKLTGGMPVILRDMDGDTYKSIARRDPWGDISAPTYWFTNVGRNVLLDDGTVRQPNYVKEWVRL
jgi:hypothetical protein